MPRLELRGLRTPHVGPIDMTVGAAECVCLWGPSGAGKTLLLRACADLDPHSGKVLLDGAAQTDMEAPRWRARVGLLLAESHWWAHKVSDHFPANGSTERIEELGLTREALAWHVERLSTGERQRLALARLLAGEPRALLLDEPTANLDADSIRRVEELVSRYRRRRGIPVLWVSHDAAQRERVGDRSLRIDSGRLIG